MKDFLCTILVFSFLFFLLSFFSFWKNGITSRHYICTVTGLNAFLQSHNAWLIWAFSKLLITSCPLSPLCSDYYSHLLFLCLIFIIPALHNLFTLQKMIVFIRHSGINGWFLVLVRYPECEGTDVLGISLIHFWNTWTSEN